MGLVGLELETTCSAGRTLTIELPAVCGNLTGMPTGSYSFDSMEDGSQKNHGTSPADAHDEHGDDDDEGIESSTVPVPATLMRRARAPGPALTITKTTSVSM